MACPRRGIVHWDVACRNVLLDARYTCRLANFCQRPETPSSDSTSGLYKSYAGQVLRRWSPPEAPGNAPHDIMGDVWALGFCLYEIFTGGKLCVKTTKPPLPFHLVSSLQFRLVLLLERSAAL